MSINSFGLSRPEVPKAVKARSSGVFRLLISIISMKIRYLNTFEDLGLNAEIVNN